MKDLARKIDSMRQFGYVLLTPKEAKRVAIELRRVERLKKQNTMLAAKAYQPPTFGKPEGMGYWINT